MCNDTWHVLVFENTFLVIYYIVFKACYMFQPGNTCMWANEELTVLLTWFATFKVSQWLYGLNCYFQVFVNKAWCPFVIYGAIFFYFLIFFLFLWQVLWFSIPSNQGILSSSTLSSKCAQFWHQIKVVTAVMTANQRITSSRFALGWTTHIRSSLWLLLAWFQTAWIAAHISMFVFCSCNRSGDLLFHICFFSLANSQAT